MWTTIFFTTPGIGFAGTVEGEGKVIPDSIRHLFQSTDQTTVGDMMAQPALPPGDFVKEYSKKMQEALIGVGFWKSCINCNEWSTEHKRCAKWSAVPPPEVIVYGCDQWLCIVPF